MNTKNRQFMFYALVVFALVVITFASLHFINLLDKPIPTETQGQLWVFVTILLSIGIQAAREYYAKQPRQETQQKLDTTLNTVQVLREEVHNGIQDSIAQKTADKVADKAAEVAAELIKSGDTNK